MAGVKMSDIAKRMGISVATVSVALNGRPGVSDTLRERILTEAAACGYDMNRLSSSTEKRLRILIYDVDHGRWGNAPEPYEFVDMRNLLLQGVEQIAEEEELELVQLRSKRGGFSLSDIPENIDGILTLNHIWDEALPQMLEQCKIPCVVVGNSYSGHRVPTVCYDNQGGMERAVEQLAEAGHKRIAFIRNGVELQNYNDRYYGWLCAQAKLGLAFGPECCLDTTNKNAHEDLVKWIMAQLPETTAFVACSDYLALRVVRALRSCGVVPGKDAAVVGFDDMPFAALCDPPLATTRIEQTLLGAAGIEYLLDLLKKPAKQVSHIFLPLQWVQRESFCAIK